MSEDQDPKPTQTYRFIVREDGEAERIDRYVTGKFAPLSRTEVQRLIKDEAVLVNDKPARAGAKLALGDAVTVIVTEAASEVVEPEAIPLDIVYEDDAVIVVNKAVGMVVHPAPGIFSGTLVNALLHHFPPIATVGEEDRPGIVHRLDQDTSGLLVVAKTDEALSSLQDQFRTHDAGRHYLALVCGAPKEDATIRVPIGRSTRDRTKMSVEGLNPREAVTHFHILERYHFSDSYGGSYALLDVSLETGRTHQIRVHLAHIGYPIAGDPTYGSGAKRAVKLSPKALKADFIGLTHQLLHAYRLRFTHPMTHRQVEFEAELTEPFQRTLDHLREAVS
ncbi:MAG: RluA family pseudouridine synthase [Candidatus Poribacteria bacterium]|nr:RluA family pseudouridine synthase [Candidatus Poribacteria bacterium]